MKKTLTIVLFLLVELVANAQDFVVEDNDTTVKSEYNGGRVWAYRQIGNLVVGMTNYVNKDGYGKNYQIQIFIKNLSETSLSFDPSMVTSKLYDKDGKTEEMKVYSFEQYMKKIKSQQAWTMALNGISAGLSIGMAGKQTTYTTSYNDNGMPYTQIHTTYNSAAASAVKMAATTQIMTLGMMMSNDKNTISQGYLKKTIIHPDEGLIGYINIKHKKGQKMQVDIPVGDNVYSFCWDVSKKKKK